MAMSWGKEAHIVDDNEQLRTAYDQVDFIQKIRLDVVNTSAINEPASVKHIQSK